MRRASSASATVVTATLALVVLTALVVLAALAVPAVAAPAGPRQASERQAAAYPYANLSVTGHGWGHGYGMGQWGALGYALSHWTYQQILAHYYGTLAAGGTTRVASLSPSQESTQVRVAIVENDGYTVAVTSASPFEVDGLHVAAGTAALLAPTSSADTRWNVFTGPSCAGPWTLSSVRDVVNPTAVPGVAEPFPSDGHLTNEVLQLCQGGGNLYLRGDIEATANSDAELRTVDIVPLEAYVADVTPAESPETWGSIDPGGPQGQPWGFQELEAQAVAARSYVMSDLGGWGGYADTCDNDCQTYVGIRWEDPTASLAVTDTAGLVVMLPDGAPATTEYSASTGGYTVEGLFAAVPDAGDAVCVTDACNPNHTWTAQVPVSAIEQTFPQIGTFESLDVTRRDGNGDWGGRVLDLTVVGSGGSVAMSGIDFSSDFYSYGVISYWFEVTSQPSGGVGGYWLDSAAGEVFSFGNATAYGSMAGRHLNAPVVSMAPTPDHRGYWLVAADGGIFSFGDALFYGSMGGMHLNEPVVGMAATPDGKGYWLVAADGGIFSFGDAHFWGSTGSMHLNKPVVGMAAAPGGTGYWLVAADGGVFSFGSATYEGSLPSLAISDTAVALLPTVDGRGYLVACADGAAYEIGDAPQFGDVLSDDPGWSGALVGGASVPG